jgi:hypothetical protein
MNQRFASKKFVAYLIGELTWKFLIFYVVWQYKERIDHYAFLVLLAMIITAGFLQVGYILGQAALDKYAHIAENAVDHKSDKDN